MKIRTRIAALSFFLLMGCYTMVLGQTSKLTPVTPEAAALTKMVNYPVDYNTGVPDIRIPFYEINVGGLKLPVDLVYHAGGFRINEQATRAGLGWSLSNDLQITRTVNGKDDFLSAGYINNSLVKTYYPNPSSCSGCTYPTSYQENYYLATGEKDASPDKFTYKLLNKSGSFYFQKNTSGSGYSIVPVPFDNIKIEFNYNQFVITDVDGTKYYFGESGAGDVNLLLSKGMEVTGAGADGTCFGCVVSAWKCKRIVSSQGIEELSFSYTPKAMVTYRSYNDYVEYYNNENPCGMINYYTSDRTEMTQTTDYNYLPPFYEISSPKYMVVYGNSAKSYFHVPRLSSTNNVVDAVYERTGVTNSSAQNIHGLSVSEISFRGGKVQFNGADKLNNIRVLGPSGEELKTVYFFQSYTAPVYTQEAKNYNGPNFQGTMYLDSLHIRNGADTYERYALGYQSKYCFGNHLKGHDAWGYPNDNTVEIAYANNTSMNVMSLPTIKRNQDRFYRDIQGGCGNFASNIPIMVTGNNWAEAPGEEAMKRGILKRIVYPTGGYADFDFEANSYTEQFNWLGAQNSLPQLCGGLRIRAINTYKEDGTFAGQKYYRYGKLEDGTGVLVNRPARAKESGQFHYGTVGYEQKIAYLKALNPGTSCDTKSCFSIYTMETKTTYQPASALDYTYSNGAPIYYEKVTEYNQDLGKKTGKTVYEYYSPEQYYNNNNAYLYAENRIEGTNISRLKTGGLMGAQKSVKKYLYNTSALSHELNDLYRLIYKKDFTYTAYLKPEQIRVNFAFLRVMYSVISGSTPVNSWTFYNPAENFSSTGHYPGQEFIYGEYGIPSGRLLPDKITETSYTDTDSLKTVTQYEYNNLPYLNPSKIKTSDSKGAEIEKQLRYAYNFTGTPVYDLMVNRNMVNARIEEIETNVTLGKEVARQKTEYSQFPVGLGVIAPVALSSSINGKPLREDQHIQEYDQYGNILEMKGRDGLPVSYLWGYRFLHPVAELKGQTYAAIPASYKSNAQIINPTSDADLRALLSGLNQPGIVADIYTYRPLVGVSSHTGPNTKPAYFEYDPVGRLIAKKDHNGRILGQYAYKMRNFSSAGASPLYLNVPVMRSQNVQDLGIWLFYNKIVEGGTMMGIDQQSADQNAIAYAENGSGTTVPDNPGSNIMADVKLRYSIATQVAAPSMLCVDFIRNDAVVATYKFKPYSSTPAEHTARIPAGTYKVSIRISAGVNYQNGCLVYSVLDMNSPGSYGSFKSGDEVVLVAGQPYEISIGTLMY